MNPKKINVAILHGVGKAEIGYADDLIKGIEKEFKACLHKITGDADNGAPKILFRPIVWDDILGVNEGKLKVVLERVLEQKKRKTFLGFWLGVGTLPIGALIWLSWAVFKQPFVFIVIFLIGGYFAYRMGSKLYFQLRTGFAAEFAMDVIGYLNPQAKDKIQARVKDEMSFVNADQEPVTFIAHSLGTVIASDFIYDRQKKKDLGNFSLSNFFTMGSPLALFALRYGAEVFNKPIHIDDPAGVWINILDKDDPIAYPLKGLNKEYTRAVWRDKEVNVGPLGIAHVQYWKDKKVHKIIAHKLALDWLRINKKLDSKTIERLRRGHEEGRKGIS